MVPWDNARVGRDRTVSRAHAVEPSAWRTSATGIGDNEDVGHFSGLDRANLVLPSQGLCWIARQALLRELAAFNKGLCLITTRLALADLVEHEGASARRLDLEHLSREAGAQLLRGLGVKVLRGGVRSVSEEFRGHCLALTLLGSYLTDAFDGEIRCRQEVSNRLVHDVRQGVHARKVMASYQSWFGEGPELSVLRLEFKAGGSLARCWFCHIFCP
jgi:hypothetical protein